MKQSPSCDMEMLTQADFDGELDAVRAAEVEVHRAGCPRCQTAYAELQNLRTRLRGTGLSYQAPEILRGELMQRIGAAPAAVNIVRRGRGWTQSVGSFGLGAAVAAVITLFVIAPGSQNMIDEVVASHVRSLQPGHLQDVASTDQHTVKPWFDGKLDFAPPVKDLKDQGFPLEGGRLDYLDGRPVAALVYGRAKHQINVFVWPAENVVADQRPITLRGYNVIHIVRDGMNLWFVSDLEKSDLAHFAEVWRATP